MSTDLPLSPAAERLDSAMDRLQEAHFLLHEMEEYYHFADPFRWHLNGYLRAIKEVPQLIQMGLQNEAGFLEWFRPARDELSGDELMRHLAKQRDFVVHRGMLVPGSSASLGIREGDRMKLWIGTKIDPLMDSDIAMERFVRSSREAGDLFGILNLHDEDTVPCIERSWALAEFPGENFLDVCARAWIRTAGLVRDSYHWCGVPLEPPALPCRHESTRVKVRIYPRERLARDDFHGIPPVPTSR